MKRCFPRSRFGFRGDPLENKALAVELPDEASCCRRQVRLNRHPWVRATERRGESRRAHLAPVAPFQVRQDADHRDEVRCRGAAAAKTGEGRLHGRDTNRPTKVPVG